MKTTREKGTASKAINAESARIAELRRQEGEAIGKLLAGLEPIYEYPHSSRIGAIGIGWRQSDKKLVEFKVAKEFLSGEFKFYVEEITLAESLEWVEKMDYAECRVGGDCMQRGPGYIRWIETLRAEVV